MRIWREFSNVKPVKNFTSDWNHKWLPTTPWLRSLSPKCLPNTQWDREFYFSYLFIYIYLYLYSYLYLYRLPNTLYLYKQKLTDRWTSVFLFAFVITKQQVNIWTHLLGFAFFLWLLFDNCFRHQVAAYTRVRTIFDKLTYCKIIIGIEFIMNLQNHLRDKLDLVATCLQLLSYQVPPVYNFLKSMITFCAFHFHNDHRFRCAWSTVPPSTLFSATARCPLLWSF